MTGRHASAHKARKRPRARGTNPRALGTNPKAVAARAFATKEPALIHVFEKTAAHWKEIQAIYPRASRVHATPDYWEELIEYAPDPFLEADIALAAVRQIEHFVRCGRLERRHLPNLLKFIRDKRYRDNWEAEARYVPPWEREDGR